MYDPSNTYELGGSMPTSNEYAESLGYRVVEDVPRMSADFRAITTSRHVECVHCGKAFAREGSIMRGHRRRCSVFQADPYTPAVCDS